MSDELLTIKSNNELFPDDTLELYRGTNGLCLMITCRDKENGKMSQLKFWPTKEDLMAMVERI